MSLNGYSGVKITECLENALGDEFNLSVRRVQQIAREFKDGDRDDVTRQVGSGRPRTLKTEANIRMVEEMVEADDGISYRAIAEATGIPKSTVFEIMQEDLSLISIVARWVPHQLNEDKKVKRVQCCENLLQNVLPKRGIKDRLFVVDEKWIYCEHFPLNTQVRRWVQADAVDEAGDRPIAIRKSQSAKKFHIIVASNFSGLTYFELLEGGGSVDSERYITFLENLFQHLNRLHIPTERVWLMHDNARPHTSRLTNAFLENSVVTRVPQAPYSPDLNLCDRYVFRNMETRRRGVTFNNAEETRNFVQEFLNSLTQIELNKEFESLTAHCSKVINKRGDYIK